MNGLNRGLLFPAYIVSSVTGPGNPRRYLVRVSLLPSGTRVSPGVISFLWPGEFLYLVGGRSSCTFSSPNG